MKIDQELVDRAFMVRNGTCGSYYKEDDVARIKEVILRKFGVSLSTSETIDFWKWRCEEWDGSWFGVNVEREGDLIEEYFHKFIQFTGVDTEEDSPEYSPPIPRTGVKVVVKDGEGALWEVELDPEYHSRLLGEIESQIPEESEGGTIRYSLEYDPGKIWGMRKMEET